MHSIKNISERNKIDTQSRADTYSGRTKYSACVSKLGKLSKQYICPQKTQKAPVFFYLKDFRLENDLKF